MGTKTDSEYFDKQKSKLAESSENRILYVYGLDTLNWENYELKRNLNLTLKKTELDTIVNYLYVNSKDSLDIYGSIQFRKKDKSIYIVGDKHHIIEPKKYMNKNLSEFPFDLYELIEPYDDANGPFLFNSDYGILNIEAWSAGKQLFYLPTNSKINIEEELLRD